MIKSITNFLIISFIFQQLKSQISQIDQNGYNAFCDETLHIKIWFYSHCIIYINTTQTNKRKYYWLLKYMYYKLKTTGLPVRGSMAKVKESGPWMENLSWPVASLSMAWMGGIWQVENTQFVGWILNWFHSLLCTSLWTFLASDFSNEGNLVYKSF